MPETRPQWYSHWWLVPMLLGQRFPGPIDQWMSIPWYRWIISQVVTIAVRCSPLRWICVMIVMIPNGANGVQSWSAPNGCRDKGHGQLLRLFSNDKTDRNLRQPARGPQFFSRASLDQLFGWRSKWHHNYKNKYGEIIQHPTGLQESPSFHFRPGFSDENCLPLDHPWKIICWCRKPASSFDDLKRWFDDSNIFKPPFLIQIADFPVFKSNHPNSKGFPAMLPLRRTMPSTGLRCYDCPCDRGTFWTVCCLWWRLYEISACTKKNPL